MYQQIRNMLYSSLYMSELYAYLHVDSVHNIVWQTKGRRWSRNDLQDVVLINMKFTSIVHFRTFLGQARHRTAPYLVFDIGVVETGVEHDDGK